MCIRDRAGTVSAVSSTTGLDVTLDAALRSVTKLGPQNLTYPLAGTGPAPAATGKAPNGTTYPVGATVSKDLINQALAAATEAGVLNATLDSRTLPILTSLPTLLDLLGGGVTTLKDLRIRTQATSAPTLALSPGGAALGTASLKGFAVIVDVKTEGNAAWQPLVKVELDAAASIGLTPVGGSFLRPTLAAWPTVKLLKATDLSSGFDVPADLLQAVWAIIPSDILPLVNSLLPAVPIPRIGPYQLTVGAIWVTNTSGNFLSVAGNLTRTPGV